VKKRLGMAVVGSVSWVSVRLMAFGIYMGWRWPIRFAGVAVSRVVEVADKLGALEWQPRAAKEQK